MSRIIHQTKKIRLDDKSLLCISDKKVSPFSWMKFIVLSKDDFTDESRDIIRHEQAHVAFGHSYDLLFLDVYSLIFWFNPFAWLLRLELQTIHEYQADEKVLAEGANAQNYHLSLIRQCVGEYKFALANNFEYNNLHKRIKMTLKTKSSSRQKWLYGTIGLSVMLCIVVLSFNGLQSQSS
jgi:beta-lactamase regulating signal transducer with metallopeptidase domain